MGHGRALVNIDTTQDQIALYEKIVGQNLSVRDTENAVKRFKANKETGETASALENTTPSYVHKGTKELAAHLAVPVDINTSGNSKGKIIIPFKSKEEFQRLINLITGE